MKLRFSLKSKEASFDADIEGLIKRGIGHRAKNLKKRGERLSKKRKEKIKD